MSKVVGARRLSNLLPGLDGKLAGYLAAASGLGTVLAQESHAVIIANTTVQPFGINGVVNIDFNNDSQIDFQIDHDRVNLNGVDIDYLQIDKNDVNGENNPLDTDSFLNYYPPGLWNESFPVNSSPHRNNDNAYLAFTNDFGDIGGYPVALKAGDVIGPMASTTPGSVPGTVWDWQENSNFLGSGTYIRANRLIDHDQGQIDASAGRAVTVPFGPQAEFPDLESFADLSPTDVRYLGVRVDLNDAGYFGNEISTVNSAGSVDDPYNYWYGWIGIRITNVAEATGEVVGYAYESQKGVAIIAGDIGTPVEGLPGDYNGDMVVDAADYTVWRNNLGDLTEANILFNGNGMSGIDIADYAWWKQNYGSSSGAGGGGLGQNAVPEPASIVMAAMGGCVLLGSFVARKLFGRYNK